MADKYYLAVETKPNNYFPVNILDLNISNGFNSDKIEEIDAFTSKFTKEIILKSIREANLLNITEDMPLVIIYKEKNVVRKGELITKDNAYNMWFFIEKNYYDKVFLNKIYNFLNNKVTKEELNNIKSSDSFKEFINNISKMPYVIQRKLYFYLNEK